MFKEIYKRKSKYNISKERLYDLYWNKELSMSQIANEIGCSYIAIRDRLVQYNIPIRTLSESRIMRRQEGELNSNFKDGRTNKYYFCIDCGKEITITSGFRGQGRCGSCAQVGKLNHNYINGLGNFPYPLEFNDQLKLKIRKRDNYTCQKCNITEEEHLIVYGVVLCVHHIDYDKEHCNEDNLITLCNECNARVNFNRKYWTEYFINKNKEEKYVDSTKD